MKRSEFLRSANVAPLQAELLAQELESENGVKWDPEEPELPTRVGVLWVCGEPSRPSRPVLAMPGRDLNVRECQAVIDTYNRYQSGELVPQDKSLQAALDAVVRERDKMAIEIQRLTKERVIPLAGALHDIARVAGVSDIHGPKETAARIINEFHERNRAITQADEKLENLTRNSVAASADVISKTSRGKTVHYAIGPTRNSRVEAERDLREWLDKERS
jgi:hypothetical protein